MKTAGKTKYLKGTLGTIFGAMMGLGTTMVSAGTITGSVHDFSTTGWTGGQICVACHTPHGADTTVADAPLWNHAVTTKTYVLYSNPATLNATLSQPTGVTKLCLSCHDGTVALDSFGGKTGTTFMTGTKAVGAGPSDLSNDHPVSFTYNTALATTDGALHDPSTRTVTIGSGTQTRTGTIAAVMLYNNTLQCASCHDVHNTFTTTDTFGTPPTNRLLKVSVAGSRLCLTCHNK
jgi:hypothetical protein